MQIDKISGSSWMMAQAAEANKQNVAKANSFAAELARAQATAENSGSSAGLGTSGNRLDSQDKVYAGTRLSGEGLTPEEQAYQQKLLKACQGFESMFLQMMWKEMRGTVHENSLFGESQGEKIFRDMLDTKMMDNISETGTFGLADVMFKQLTAVDQAKKDMAARARAAQEAKGVHVGMPEK